MPRPEPLYPGHYYHIYNRGNNGETLFREQRNYVYFLRLYAQYIWLYSSYPAILSEEPSRIQRADALEWFGSRPGFEAAHRILPDETLIKPLIVGDWI